MDDPISTYYDNQPERVAVSDGLVLFRGQRMGLARSPYWYHCANNRGSWRDWVCLAHQILDARADLLNLLNTKAVQEIHASPNIPPQGAD